MIEHVKGLNQQKAPRHSMADEIYSQLKQMIFDFVLLPSEIFSESDVAERFSASRTPVREALQRLQREGYMDVRFRSGWQVKPFDFNAIEQLYDVRIILECAAIERLCAMPEVPEKLTQLREFWDMPTDQRQHHIGLSEEDKAFHSAIVAASGNAEMAKIHSDISERIHIVRRLDFTKDARIEATFDEHAAILEAISDRRGERAKQLMQAHIAVSRDEVRKITIHMLHEARECIKS